MGDPSLELTPGARAILKEVGDRPSKGQDSPGPGLHHWLAVFLERHGAMAEDLSGLDARSLLADVRKHIREGDPGDTLAVEDLLEGAESAALARSAAKIGERDIGSAILSAAGFKRVPPASKPATKPATSREPTPDATTSSSRGTSPSAHDETPQDPAPGVKLRAHRKTPLLEQIGRDLTKAAAEGKFPPLVGRDQELATTIETLCRVTKRNPVLLGPAGVGKTAIVEGLAQQIVTGDVPDCLQGVRLVEVKMGSLVGGAGFVGKLEERMTQLLSEASGSDLILFIDEIHSILGSGSSGRDMDVAGLLKPALARGDLALVGATTDAEYKRILDQDAALERRFQPVHVGEMTRDQALDVLRVQRDRFAESRRVTIGDDVLAWLVSFAGDFMRNRHFPDKAIDLLEQCVARALVERRAELGVETCREVAQQLVGMPLGVDERLDRLRDRLQAAAILSEEAAEELLGRLRLTMGGHDFDPERPNAILLLAGDAAAHADLLAGVVAEALFGSPQRVITIDLGGYLDNDQSALTRLLGVPYGYVGAELSRGAVQQLSGQPWSAVVIRNIDKCGWMYVDLVTQALAGGYFTDAHGTRQYLSDAVVLLTAESARAEEGRPFGFVSTNDDTSDKSAERLVEKLLGPTVAALCQVVGTSAVGQGSRGWLANVALPRVTERYARDGLLIEWDKSVVDWLSEVGAGAVRRDEWMGVLEETLGPLLVDLFKNPPSNPVTLLHEDGELKARVIETGH